MSTILETQRLVLRPPTPADADAIARYLNNFAVAGNLSRVPYPYARRDAEGWLAHRRAAPPPEETDFAIELPGAGYIGQVGFHCDADCPTIGYWLAEPFWHRGFMTEAAAAAVDWYFGATGEPLIYSGVFHFNKASLAVQKKLGFTETGVSTRHCLARGEDVRHIDTQLSRADRAGAKS
jgi:RimJ/RimL family protein N-acetyltransferase